MVLSVYTGIFASFLQAGFECSTHRYGNKRLDLLEETCHTRFAAQDFRRVAKLGMRTVRTGARWHLIESTPGSYDFSSLRPILDAAEQTDTEVLLDLFHFGWPEHLDIYDPEFSDAFARYVWATVRYLKSRGRHYKFFAPVNEISFLSWIAGDVRNFYPHSAGRGPEFKAALIRAAVAASEILLNEIAGVRLLWPEPAIHIVGNPQVPGDPERAEFFRQLQYEAWDQIAGRQRPELGGRPEYLDVLGLNYYDQNQWVHNGGRLDLGDSRYRPFREILLEVSARYDRPLFISETGAEEHKREGWFRYVCQEVVAARELGVHAEGICLYPILNHPGWEDDRHCHNGLFDYAREDGYREMYRPLASAILELQEKLQERSPQPMSYGQMDFLCLSHLRWGFVLQRPQHLMGRFAREHRVFYFEEPLYEGGEPSLRESICPKTGVRIITPILSPGLSESEIAGAQRHLLAILIERHNLISYAAWYYTPMAMEFSDALDPVLTVYDCMDELTGFAGASPNMKVNEDALFQQADLVFTGGASLYEAKRTKHKSVCLFPSSVDTAHFERAKTSLSEPIDQATIPEPRLGYAGVIDERMDLHLLGGLARAKPEWQFVLLGPVAKISQEDIPVAPNIHWLGMKKYDELPDYLAGWTIGMLPFAANEATRYISPTKTPEYLAAGLRVISTPLRDVVTPYGDLGLVSIADGVEQFISSAEEILRKPTDPEFSSRVGHFLNQSSWEKTWSEMDQLIRKEWGKHESAEAAGIDIEGVQHV